MLPLPLRHAMLTSPAAAADAAGCRLQPPPRHAAAAIFQPFFCRDAADCIIARHTTPMPPPFSPMLLPFFSFFILPFIFAAMSRHAASH